MHRLFVILTVLVTSPFAIRAMGDGRNSLLPQGTPGAELLLADEGKSEYRILVPAKPSDIETKAATELQRWLKEMTSVLIPVVNEGSSDATGDKFLSIGGTQLAQRIVSSEDLQKVGKEGYIIRQTASSLVITGGPLRGVINGVFCLLEEDLGCRWYAGKSFDAPSISTLRAKVVSRSFSPPLDVRYPFYYEAGHPDEEWALRNRYSSIQRRMPDDFGGGRRLQQEWFVHSFNAVLSQTKDFATHPEYFSLIDGKRSSRQLCLTNPDVLRITIEKARKAIDACATTEFISISDYDGGGHCECPECAKLDAENGSPAGSNLTFVNRVAEALEASHPNITVLALAYLDTLDAPTKVKPRSNVAVQFCNDLHSWRWPLMPFTDSHHILSKRYIKALDDWSRICDKIYIWDYTTNFSHYIAPMPNMHVIEPSVKFYLARNVKGIMFQGSYQAPGERGAMRTWVMTKQLWDPTRHIDVLTDDFVQGYYREAAGPIGEYYKLLDVAGRANQESVNEQISGIRFRMDAPFITRDFVTQASQLLKQAETLCKSDEMRRRVALEKVPLLYVKLVRGKSVSDDDRKALLDEFEAIATREKLTTIAEGPPDLMARIAQWRKTIDNPPAQTKARIQPSTFVFLDDAKVERIRNLKRTMHQPVKRGAVLKPDTEAGETMIQARSAPMWIPSEGLYRLPYIAVLEGRWQPLLAESKDGLTWTRPDLGSANMTPRNRITVNASDAKWRDSENVVFDPTDPDPARRYKALAGATGRLPCVSADCKVFTVIEQTPLPAGDESQLYHDRAHQQFIAAVKTFSEFGRSVGIATSDDFRNWTSVNTVFHTDAEDQQRARKVIKDRVTDKSLMPLASVDPEPAADHVPNLKALGTWGCDVYNMAVFAYADGYVGLPAVFYRTGLDADRNNTDGFHEIQLTWSRDLKTWQRIGDRAPFIAASRIEPQRLGVFDRTQLLPTSSPIEHGDELWFYYTGLKWRDQPYAFQAGLKPRPKSEWTKDELADDAEGGGAVCLAVLRRDGFVSLDAGETVGELTTRALFLKGDSLFLNVNAAKGDVRVELVQLGKVLPGYSFEDCIPMQADGVRCPVQWKNATLKDLNGERVQLRIQLRNASLYAVSFEK
jgi:hypothetical protein